MEELQSLVGVALHRIGEATTIHELHSIRADYLGKKGRVADLLRALKDATPEDRKTQGQEINVAKDRIETALRDAQEQLALREERAQLAAGSIDVTRPARRLALGSPHPLRIIQDDIVQALVQLGFEVADGPQVETDWYNFEALNIQADHPARDMQDTFFVSPGVVLRTHTSNVQIRVMEGRTPPVRIVCPGMVYRRDDVDATHSPVFHQVEALWIDHSATFADLRGVLRRLASTLFGSQIDIRMRPSFFPFTEPSAEVDVRRPGGRWLEVLGAGMVDPAVLQAVGYDPEVARGFAFGIGVERVAMMRWGIEDIRHFYDNDMRFLRQFGGG